MINVDWEEIKTSVDSEFYVFVNHFLKLEIREIQKYIFDLIECVLKVSDQDPKSSEKIKEIFSTGVVASSTINEISKIENDQKFEEKILEILAILLKHKKFFQIFRKNKGIEMLIKYHSTCENERAKLIIARVMLEGLKSGIFRPFKIFQKFMDCIIEEIT